MEKIAEFMKSVNDDCEGDDYIELRVGHNETGIWYAKLVAGEMDVLDFDGEQTMTCMGATMQQAVDALNRKCGETYPR